MRDMCLEDLPTILEIDALNGAAFWTKAQFEASLYRGDWCFVSLNETGHVQGYCIGMNAVDTCELLLIGVHLDYQRQGIASSLLSELTRRAVEQGLDRILLEVRSTNTVAQVCYIRNGFKQIGCRKGYYLNKDGREDALIFERLLNVME